MFHWLSSALARLCGPELNLSLHRQALARANYGKSQFCREIKTNCAAARSLGFKGRTCERLNVTLLVLMRGCLDSRVKGSRCCGRYRRRCCFYIVTRVLFTVPAVVLLRTSSETNRARLVSQVAATQWNADNSKTFGAQTALISLVKG